MYYIENRFICEILIDKGEIVKMEMEKYYDKVKMMGLDYIEIIENKDCSIVKIVIDV